MAGAPWSLSFCHTSEPLQRYRPQVSSVVMRDDRQEINQQLEGNTCHSPAFLATKPAFLKATKPAFLKATKSSRAYTFKLLLVGCPVLYILSLIPSSWVQYTNAIYSCLCRYTRIRAYKYESINWNGVGLKQRRTVQRRSSF